MAILQQFGDDIWIADGPSVRFMLADLPTRMVVVKLSDGSVWVNSPIPISSDALKEIHTIGPVQYLVAPTLLHVWRLEQGLAVFPQAQLWGPPKVRTDRHTSQFSGLLHDQPPAAWSLDIDQLVFKGNALIEEVEFFHKKSRTLIMTDFLQNYRTEDGGVLKNFLKRIGGVLDGGVPLDIRLSFTNQQLARRSLEKLLSWDFDGLIVAHGACLERGGEALVRKAFRWLLRSS